MAYEINFCETKEQLKHLAEVVTGKADGSPNGEDIDTSTLAYAGLVRNTLPELLSKLGWYSVGDWSSDPLISNDNQYVLYNGIRYVPLSTPYQVNSTANPDPEVLVGAELKVITDVTNSDLTDAQNELLPPSSRIYPSDGLLQNGQVVDSGTTHLRVEIDGKPTIVAMSPIADGVVSLLAENGATIGGVGVNFKGFVSYNGVEEMLASESLVVGFTYCTGGTTWVMKTKSNPVVISDFSALNPIFIDDFHVGDDTQAVQNCLNAGLLNSGEITSSPGRTYTVDEFITTTGDGTQNIILDLKGSQININTAILRGIEFKNLNSFTSRNTIIDGNGDEHFGLVVEQIDTIAIEPTTHIKNISEDSDVIIAGLFIRDCKNGFASPTVSDIINVPSDGINPSGVGRGVMVSDQINNECNLTISPNISNVPGTSDGDGVYLEYSGSGSQADIKGGVKVIGGVYNNCGKRNIKSHMPNVTISDNRGKNETGNPMYAFVSAYGGSAVVSGNAFECEKHVTYKTEVLSDLLPSSIGASYVISGNQFFAGVNPSGSDTDYLLNIQVSSTEFDSITLSNNQDRGAGRAIRGFNNNVGSSLSAYNNKLKDVSDTPFNLTGIMLDSLTIKDNFTPDVASEYLVAMAGCTIESTTIIGNDGDFSFGVIQADSDFRPQNVYGNGSNTRLTSNSQAIFRDGVKYVFRNNTEPTSGKFLVGDKLINNLPSPGGWSSKVCTTSGDAALATAVFKIDGQIEV